MRRIKGMDISMLPEIEALGAEFYDGGEKEDLLAILKRYDVNTIRIRLWNHPYDEEGRPYGGGTNDLDSVIQLAKRVQEKGFDFLLDFHYSDFWTDPRKQVKPKAWEGLDYNALKREVYCYTKEVLDALDENGIRPDIVQVGNEITNGFLWPEGQLPTYQNCVSGQAPREYENMFGLLKEGIRAVREKDNKIKILLHLDYGGDNGLYREWFDAAERSSVDYDIIGLSYYPYWHGTLQDLSRNLNDISKRYEKDTVVAETAYGFTTKDMEGCTLIFGQEQEEAAGYEANPEGQAAFLKDLWDCICSVEGERGAGFVYWEPCWVPVMGSTWASREGQIYMNDEAKGGNSWANQALFDYDGKALPSLKIMKEW